MSESPTYETMRGYGWSQNQIAAEIEQRRQNSHREAASIARAEAELEAQAAYRNSNLYVTSPSWAEHLELQARVNRLEELVAHMRFQGESC